jgi:hypothetical protein
MHASPNRNSCGDRSIFVTIIKSEEAKILGYFKAYHQLMRITTTLFLRRVELSRAYEISHFRQRYASIRDVNSFNARPTICASVAGLPGVNLTAATPVVAIPFHIPARLLISFDHGIVEWSLNLN